MIYWSVGESSVIQCVCLIHWDVYERVGASAYWCGEIARELEGPGQRLSVFKEKGRLMRVREQRIVLWQP